MALPNPISQSPSPSRRSSCDSPEFEFQFNPSFPSPTSLNSADQLFFRGFLRPLHLLPHKNSDDPDPVLLNPSSSEINPVSAEPSEPLAPVTDPPPSPSILSTGITASKRWRHVFKKTDKKPPDEDKSKNKDSHKQREKEKKRDNRRSGAAANSAELNINIWPFSRSRSAGNNSSGRNKSSLAATRKVSSAPCSRSNSSGESKSRRNWPTSPARTGGVHLGRTSPVWQLPRTLSGRAAEKGKKEAGEVNRRSKAAKATGATAGGKGRVLSISVPMCIGYRHHLSCRSDEASAVGGEAIVDGGEEDSAAGGSRIVASSGGNLFNLRSLFSKKVY